MSKLSHRVFAAFTTLVVSLIGCAGRLQAAGCNTFANVTTWTPANRQLIYVDVTGEYHAYSSDIVQSGVGDSVSNVNVTLIGVITSIGRHIWAMLVGPNGNNIVFFGIPCNGESGQRKIPGPTLLGLSRIHARIAPRSCKSGTFGGAQLSVDRQFA